MTTKQFALDDSITILVSKRSSNRRIRLTIASDGMVKVSIPRWLPYSAAVDFAKSKSDWIIKKLPEPTVLLPNRPIGKNHQLVFKRTDKNAVSTRLKDLEAVVFVPGTNKIQDQEVQKAAKRVIKKALAKQASKLLPMRVKQLAEQHSFEYTDLRIKSLKTRWGSCDNHKIITLNLYLMELPWELIDYVILHELNHTLVMQHGSQFWQSLGAKLPNYSELKKQLKNYPTTV